VTRALIVLNPNSSERVTQAIDRAVEPLRAWGTPVRCVTLSDGPPGIETQAEADRVVPPLLDLARRLEPEAAGYVIACFGDPGLHALRDETSLPVVGIQEAAITTALRLGHRFGVISILPASVPRHLRAFGAMGVTDRLAGDRAIGLGVADLAQPGRTLGAMVATGCRLRDEDGADVLVMGCAGMAGYREALEAETGLPVVEPCQAGTAAALAQVALGLTHRRGPA
jgi:allantoin racemase